MISEAFSDNIGGNSSPCVIGIADAAAIKVFTDIKSGKTMDRPGLVELLAYARAGDTLAIVRLDRLGRSLAELLETVKMLRERQIDLLSLEEKIDTSSAAGQLIFRVFGAIAHFERRLISERTKDSIAAARATGKLPGRQPLDIKRVEAAIKLIEEKTSPDSSPALDCVQRMWSPESLPIQRQNPAQRQRSQA